MYNPKDDTVKNISYYNELVDKVYVIDNSDKENNLKELLKTYPNTEYVSMGGNMGIGAALNRGVALALDDGADYCLTMDQDSIFPTNKMDLILKYLESNQINHEYGIIGLAFNSTEVEEKLVEEPHLLTSGNFIDLSLYKTIKGYNKDLFIDYVDFELDEQFYNIGKKVAYINNVSLIHELGSPLVKRFLWRKVVCNNHSPIRYYYRFRNNLYLYKKNKAFYKVKYKWDMHHDILKVILFEPKKIAKLKMIKRGRKDARRGILGPYKEK